MSTIKDDEPNPFSVDLFEIDPSPRRGCDERDEASTARVDQGNSQEEPQPPALRIIESIDRATCSDCIDSAEAAAPIHEGYEEGKVAASESSHTKVSSNNEVDCMNAEDDDDDTCSLFAKIKIYTVSQDTWDEQSRPENSDIIKKAIVKASQARPNVNNGKNEPGPLPVGPFRAPPLDGMGAGDECEASDARDNPHAMETRSSRNTMNPIIIAQQASCIDDGIEILAPPQGENHEEVVDPPFEAHLSSRNEMHDSIGGDYVLFTKIQASCSQDTWPEQNVENAARDFASCNETPPALPAKVYAKRNKDEQNFSVDTIFKSSPRKVHEACDEASSTIDKTPSSSPSPLRTVDCDVQAACSADGNIEVVAQQVGNYEKKDAAHEANIISSNEVGVYAKGGGYSSLSSPPMCGGYYERDEATSSSSVVQAACIDSIEITLPPQVGNAKDMVALFEAETSSSELSNAKGGSGVLVAETDIAFSQDTRDESSARHRDPGSKEALASIARLSDRISVLEAKVAKQDKLIEEFQAADTWCDVFHRLPVPEPLSIQSMMSACLLRTRCCGRLLW